MRTIIHCLSLALLLLGPVQQALAECVHQNVGIRAGTMHSTVNLDLSGDTPADTFLGSFEFTRDGDNTAVAQCSPGSEVLLYATHGEGSGIFATYYKEIDGRPTYHLTKGPKGLAYAIEDMATGVYFTSRPGGRSPRPEGPLNTPNARLYLYAAVDNPVVNISKMYIGALMVSPYIVGAGAGNNTAVGFPFLATVKVKSVTSCQVTNQDLRIRLPGISINNFPEPGLARQPVKAQDQLNVKCTGDMTASIRVSGNHGTEDYKGRSVVFKPMNEGKGGNATGFGFVLSAPGYADDYLAHNESTSLGKISKGEKSIPIQAEYFRYGRDARAGELDGSASFVIQFN